MLSQKKKLIALFLIIFLFNATAAFAAPNPSVTAEAAVLIDATTGKIIYGKNQFEARPPASTTKILTTLLAIELNDLDEIVTISQRAANTGESRLNLIEGEKISISNLLHGALLKSANDACVALAEGTSGTVEEFVRLMNMKARLIGCMNTNFTNTNGLPDPKHYSTAFDLALMARAALENETFSKLVQTQKATVYWENGRQRQVKNTNNLLHTYPGAIGVKTGTTNAAGQCLVSAAERDGQRLIAVVLKSQSRYVDSMKLLDYGFNYYTNINIIDKNSTIDVSLQKNKIQVKPSNDLIVTIPKDTTLNIQKKICIYSDLPKKIKSNTNIGYIDVFNNDVRIGRVQLYSL